MVRLSPFRQWQQLQQLLNGLIIPRVMVLHLRSKIFLAIRFYGSCWKILHAKSKVSESDQNVWHFMCQDIGEPLWAFWCVTICLYLTGKEINPYNIHLKHYWKLSGRGFYEDLTAEKQQEAKSGFLPSGSSSNGSTTSTIIRQTPCGKDQQLPIAKMEKG